MDILFSFLLLALGFIILIMGAHWLVKGAASLAKRLNVPQIVIGLTLVAFGTSTPELVVNISAALRGAADLSFGNIIGSNNFNIFIILGISALIYPMQVKRDTTYKEIPFALFSSLILLLMVNDTWFDGNSINLLSRGDGLILLGLFILFIMYAHNLSKQEQETEKPFKTHKLPLLLLFILGGLTGLVLGGNWVVKYALIIARDVGISEKIIGLTIVAAGTSLPELATSAVAAYKKHSDIALGNIVGSNIFNLLLILGITAQIKPLPYQSSFNTDQYVMLLSVILLFGFVFIPHRHTLNRWQGALLILVYAVYTAFLIK